jgi:soluble lytic murein transglycosylase-like protein
MARSEEARKPLVFSERRPHAASEEPWGPSEPRTIVIRHGSGWQSLAVLFLCLLLGGAVLLGHWVVRGLDRKNQDSEAAMARAERKIQQLESGFTFEARRRQMLLGMRNHILKANPKVSLTDSYRYAEMALAACEKYPGLDPLLLLAIGIVESGYDPQARSPADARGLYQIWPSTGKLLARTLGWTWDDSMLYDPEKNTQAAALYLDVLFSTYKDPKLVLAEYNGGPLNAGYMRAGVAALAAETRTYVPRVLELHQRLQQEFEAGTALAGPAEPQDNPERRGKKLGAP